MKNILVAVDFHSGDKIILKKAIQLAKPFKSKLWIIHIAAPNPDFVGFDAGPQTERDSRATQLKTEHQKIQKYSTAIQDQGLDVESLLVQGPTTETVLDEATKLSADLIITGHRKHGLFYKALLGSVSSDIIKKSNIPVLVVPINE
ncbi:MAG: universal stress protein [Flammeovirgaceae bacterium]|nr:universal stress protein [Flammeovirgaceae bacterium]MBE61409.1 universal stress protein [Flammeovirgaceae bacterium]MBR09791.1 universal stress protein [Rickettsiales bacterium]HCX20460.1 universal stress protein [Cytophagales bacterium]|tara:strand:- start:25 stop:462 length:438 start_codon:yes stop_codon:yes gene_type:complete